MKGQPLELNAEETTYKLADDELWLNASAEHSLCNMYMDEIYPQRFSYRLGNSAMPLSFPQGSGYIWQRYRRPQFVLHQFDKLEMEVLLLQRTGLD